MLPHTARIIAYDEFEPPFGDICRDIDQSTTAMYGGLAKHMRGQWGELSLNVHFIDTPEVQAFASKSSDGYHIQIHRGSIERIYGVFFGLMSCPLFLPRLGNANLETFPAHLHGKELNPVKILKAEASLQREVPLPLDSQRRIAAQLLATFALDFLAYHELGHIVAGHLELLGDMGAQPKIAEFHDTTSEIVPSELQHVLECDADFFACHVLGHVNLHKQIAQTVHQSFQDTTWNKEQLVHYLYFATVAVLFRLLYPRMPIGITRYSETHPHPAVRAFIASFCTTQRSKQTESASDVELVSFESISNVENVWRLLHFPGQNSESNDSWFDSILQDMNRQLTAYAACAPKLDQYSHLERRWYDWEWNANSAGSVE